MGPLLLPLNILPSLSQVAVDQPYCLLCVRDLSRNSYSIAQIGGDYFRLSLWKRPCRPS